MKINIADPQSGAQKTFEFEDERKLQCFMDKRVSQEVEMSSVGEEWAGYVVKVTGGHDKQGFPMYQGVLLPSRVKLLLHARAMGNTRGRDGERARKSVRGCIIDHDISVIHATIVKKGPASIPDLSDKRVPLRLGPKRASKIRRLFDLEKEDDVRQYVIRRTIEKEGKKPYTKAPKIQRLITPLRLHRKRRLLREKKTRREKTTQARATYVALIASRRKAAHDKKRGVAAPAAAAKPAKAAAPSKAAPAKAGKAGKAGKAAPKAAVPAKAAAPAAKVAPKKK